MSKNRRMVKSVGFKPNPRIRSVLDKLCSGRPIRKLITLQSEKNLGKASQANSLGVDLLLERLEQLHYLALAPDQLIVPQAAAFPHNLEFLVGLGKKGLGHFAELMGVMEEKEGDKRILDLRKVGLRNELAQPSLASEIEIIRTAKNEIEKDEELCNLVIFRALLAARIELYTLGEAKSAARESGNIANYEEYANRMLKFAQKLSELIEIFPFGKIDYRQKIKGKFENARDKVQSLNNPAADSVLSSLTPKLMGILEKQEIKRVRASKRYISHKGLRVSGGKIRIIDDLRGECIITGQGYKKTAAGILRKTIIEHGVSVHKILSMIDHTIESVEGEKEKNQKLIAELKMVSEDPLSKKEELLEECLELSLVKDIGKRKAQVELWGALELTSIPTEQAQRLARSLVGMAVIDLERRNEILEAQKESLSRLKTHTEKLIGKILKDLAQRWAKYFAKEGRDLKNLKTLDKIQQRLGKYLGTLLGPKKENLRERWLRQARSHITGVLRQMSGIAKLLKETAKEEEGIDEKLKDAPIKAARHILLIEFDFINRDRTFKKGERKKALKTFYREKAKSYGPKIAIIDAQAEMDL